MWKDIKHLKSIIIEYNIQLIWKILRNYQLEMLWIVLKNLRHSLKQKEA